MFYVAFPLSPGGERCLLVSEHRELGSGRSLVLLPQLSISALMFQLFNLLVKRKGLFLLTVFYISLAP